jgi:hypothetical protein
MVIYFPRCIDLGCYPNHGHVLPLILVIRVVTIGFLGLVVIIMIVWVIKSIHPPDYLVDSEDLWATLILIYPKNSNNRNISTNPNYLNNSNHRVKFRLSPSASVRSFGRTYSAGGS